LTRGEAVDVNGSDWSAHVPAGMVNPRHTIPVLLAALSPRLLRVAGQYADGVVLWIAPPAAIETHIAPRVRAAAAAVGRPSPRIVAGLPVAVHDDVAEARSAIARTADVYANEPNYRRVLELGGLTEASDAAIVGNEQSVRRQLQSVLDAGATDLWLNIVPAGDEPRDSIARTRRLLIELLQ